MTLQSVINGARELVAGISATQRYIKASKHMIDVWQEAIAEREHFDEQLSDVESKLMDRTIELEEERAAHEETKRKLAENQSHLGAGINTLNKFSGDYYRDFTELQKVKAELASHDAKAEEITKVYNELSSSHLERAEKAESELASALETIDALTRKRWQSAEPVPMGVGTVVIYESDLHVGKIWSPAFGMAPEWKWTYTPASWEAARKTGTE